jgi:hypothetical protein
VNGLVIGDNLDVPKLEILLGEREVDSEYKFFKTVTKLYFKTHFYVHSVFGLGECGRLRQRLRRFVSARLWESVSSQKSFSLKERQ